MLNRELVGKRYPEQRWDVTPESVRRFAEACDEDNPAFLDDSRPDGVIAPPLYAIVAAFPSETQVVTDESLTGPSGEFFRRMVRGDNDVVWSDVIRPGDALTSTAVVSGIEEKENGELLRVDVTLRRNGREVARVGCGYFVRGEKPKNASGGKQAGSSNQPRGPVVGSADMHVAADQPIRYAEASGDRNPIHTDPEVAKLFGHPGIILQGSCTMALVAHGVIDHLCGGDPRKLKRLRVRYARPVLPGDTLTTIFWRLDDASAGVQYGLEAKRQDGTVVIKNAFADISR